MKIDDSTICFALAVVLALVLASQARAVTVTKGDDLAFGAVLSGASGTVTVPASNGPPVATGGVLLGGAQFPHGGAASFDVTNDTASPATYALSLQASPSDLGSAGLALSNFALSQNSVTLGPGASQRIYVGAQLTLSGALLSSGPHAATVPLTLLAQ
jgi:hypothetical protein